MGASATIRARQRAAGCEGAGRGVGQRHLKDANEQSPSVRRRAAFRAIARSAAPSPRRDWTLEGPLKVRLTLCGRSSPTTATQF